jgi:hypothetical protein
MDFLKPHYDTEGSFGLHMKDARAQVMFGSGKSARRLNNVVRRALRFGNSSQKRSATVAGLCRLNPGGTMSDPVALSLVG